MGSRKLKYYCNKCKKEISRNNQSSLCFDCIQDNQYQERVDAWLKAGNLNLVGRPRGYVRKYFYIKQNYKCAICGLPNTWNEKHIEFVLDHINGRANDHSPSNLRLICPNCDSQLDTFKSRNKNSTRIYDKINRLNKWRNGRAD